MFFTYRRKGCRHNLSHLKAILGSTWRFGEVVLSRSPEVYGWGEDLEVNPLKTAGEKTERVITSIWVQPDPEVPFSDPNWWLEEPKGRIYRTYAARKVA